MSRRAVGLTLALALLGSSAVLAQYTKLVSDFENAAWTPYVTITLFRHPNFSPSSTGLDLVDPNSSYLTETSTNPFSVVHSGLRGVESTWSWANPGYHTSWVRLVTFNADQVRNPALHLGGKVRFWFSAKAYTSATYATPVSNGHLYLGLGVRETGQGMYLGGDGGITGDIEWVGLNARLAEILPGTNGICDTTALAGSDDVQLVAPGASAGPDTVCIGAGPDGLLQTAVAGDDIVRVTPVGMFSVPTDGVMRQYEFDFPTLQAAGKVFSFAGNGQLGATPNNRGALEHLVLTNDPTNAAVSAKVFLIDVDDLEFEAPLIDPPEIVTEPNMPQPLDQSVEVGHVLPTATDVRVYRVNADNSETLLGSASPTGQPNIVVPTNPLASNVRIVARQSIGALTSDNSVPVIATRPGNGPLRMAMAVRETDAYDHSLACGGNGTGYDPSQPSTLEFIGANGQDAFGVPNCPRFTPSLNWFEIQFKPCDPTWGVTAFSGNGVLAINAAPNYTNGVWEGLYFRIDELSPTTGPYTVYLDDMTVKTNTGTIVCTVDDFESYTPGRCVVADCAGNGMADTTAAPTDVQVVSVGSTTFCGQIIVNPGPDGTLETTPQGDDGTSLIHARFDYPLNSGTSVGLAASPNVSAVTTEEAHSGLHSLKLQWGFADASNLRSVLRLTSNGSLATNPPETFLSPDSVIPFSLDGTYCDGNGDLLYSVWVKLAPPLMPGDWDVDGDLDLVDMAAFQRCFAQSPTTGGCGTFDIAPNHAPDGIIGMADFGLLNYLLVGPGL